MNTELKLADWCSRVERSVLRQLIGVVSQPGILSFAGGLPATELFPTAGLTTAFATVLANDPLALQYRPPFVPLKKHIVTLMAKRGVTCVEDQIFITTGAQQGLDVLARMLLNPGGEIIIEEIVYTGLQQVINPLQPKIYTVKTDMQTGIDVDAVEEHLKNGVRPAFLYVVPNAQNPLGVSISTEKRAKLAQLAAEYHVPIIEDDPYGFLSYDEGDHTSCIKALQSDWVFYLGSFSKILAPGLRLGWAVVPVELVGKMTVTKEACDLESSGLIQRAISAYLDLGEFDTHLATLIAEYKLRRDTMMDCLHKYFPSDATWTVPNAGMFVWVALRPGVDTNDLLKFCLETEKVAFVPGYAFAVPGTNCSNCLRLNFSCSNSDKIRDGMERLGKAINRYLTNKTAQ